MTSLCERVDFIIKEKKISRTQLARTLGKPQQTFNSYFHSPRGKALAALTGRKSEGAPEIIAGVGDSTAMHPLSVFGIITHPPIFPAIWGKPGAL